MRKNIFVAHSRDLHISYVQSCTAIRFSHEARLADASNNSTQTAGRLAGQARGALQERRGIFRAFHSRAGTQDLNIDFTSAQLNDALKSLTVLDLGDGHITGVRFNSVAPLSERLKTLRLPLGEEASRGDFLEALRGTRVEVHSGTASTTGKVLGIDTRKISGRMPTRWKRLRS